MRRTIILVFMTVFFGMFLIPGLATAWDEAQLQQLKTKNECSICDLSGATLTDGSVCKSGSATECKK